MSQAARHRPPSGRRAQQRAIETRVRLVDAALDVFASRGFEGATTREIASRAGVALAALPYHFSTKEALWKAAADRIFGMLRDHFDPYRTSMHGADVRSRLRVVLRQLVRFAAEHPELHRFMLQEGTDRSERLAWLVETHVRPFYRISAELIGEAQGLGLLVEGRPELVFYTLIAAASLPYSVAPERELLTQTGSDSTYVDDHAELLLRLFNLTESSPSGRR